MHDTLIQPLLSEDIAYLDGLTPDGWDDVAPAFQRYLDMAFCVPYKTIVNDRIAGLGCLIYYEHTVWLAAIIVHPEYRNGGIGKAITQWLIDKVDRHRYKTILLDATEFGYPVYSKLGFEQVGEYHHYKGPLLSVGQDDLIVQYDAQYREQILHLDKQATGEGRQALLLLHIQSSMLYVKSGEVQGAYFPTLYRGMIVVSNTEAGMALMKYRMTAKEYCMLPAANKAAIDLIQQSGATYLRASRRMMLGEGVQWQPEWICNTINGAMG